MRTGIEPATTKSIVLSAELSRQNREWDSNPRPIGTYGR